LSSFPIVVKTSDISLYSDEEKRKYQITKFLKNSSLIIIKVLCNATELLGVSRHFSVGMLWLLKGVL